MPRRRLGRDGPEVGAIGLGCMSFAGVFGDTDEATSHATLSAALAAGIDFWDTANIYGAGRSERVIGAYLAACRPNVVLATKVGIVPGPPRRYDNSDDHIRSALEGSLSRLGVEHVDLCYIHRRDPSRPVETVVETLARLIEDGLIGGYGLSEIAPATLRRAHAVHPCRAVQSEYSLWTRLPELGLLQTCAELGVAFVAFSPLARGVLGGAPLNVDDLDAGDFRRTIPRFQAPHYAWNAAAVARFRAFCAARGWPVPAAALAWMLDRWPHLLPIPGTRHAAHLSQWLMAPRIAFTPADRADIARLLPPGFASGDRYADPRAAGVEPYG